MKDRIIKDIIQSEIKKIINVRTTYNPAITSSIITPKLFLNFLSKKLIGNGFLISKNLNKIKIYK